jgi:hypothetical protein
MSNMLKKKVCRTFDSETHLAEIKPSVLAISKPTLQKKSLFYSQLIA